VVADGGRVVDFPVTQTHRSEYTNFIQNNSTRNTFIAFLDRWIKEAKYIRKEQDKSMNRDQRSYPLSHVYDKRFAAMTPSGAGKLTTSFRRRQQLLPKREYFHTIEGCFLMNFYILIVFITVVVLNHISSTWHDNVISANTST